MNKNLHICTHIYICIKYFWEYVLKYEIGSFWEGCIFLTFLPYIYYICKMYFKIYGRKWMKRQAIAISDGWHIIYLYLCIGVKTIAQLHSSHTLVKYCSKFSKPGFSNTWTVKFQIFKLVLEKTEEPEIKLPTSAGSWKKQESSRKTSISALFTMLKPLTMWITINCGKFWKR